MLKYVYWSKINNNVYGFDAGGEAVRAIEGKHEDVVEMVMGEAGPKTEFYISFSGQMNFVKVSGAEWAKV